MATNAISFQMAQSTPVSLSAFGAAVSKEDVQVGSYYRATPTSYEGLGYVTVDGQNFYGWHLTNETASNLVDKITRTKEVSVTGFIEKLKKVFNDLSVEVRTEISCLYPDFVNKVESWILVNPQMVILDMVDFRIYFTFQEAFEDDGAEGCVGQEGAIIFALRSDTSAYLMNDSRNIKDMLTIADIEWFTHCWGRAFNKDV